MANGVFVDPEAVQTALQRCEFVEQIFVYADPIREFLVAVVIPNVPILVEYFNKASIPFR